VIDLEPERGLERLTPPYHFDFDRRSGSVSSRVPGDPDLGELLIDLEEDRQRGSRA
jgi:hypothetical protein